MKNKKIIWLVLGIGLFACTAFIISLGIFSASRVQDATDVGDQYLAAVQDQDYAEAIRWAHPVSNMTEEVLADFFSGMNITEWSFTSEQIDGATATLDGEIVINGGRRPLQLFLYRAEEHWWVVSISISP